MIAGPSMFAHPATFPAELKARYLGTMQAVAGLARRSARCSASSRGPGSAAGFWVLWPWQRPGRGARGGGHKRRAELRAAAERTRPAPGNRRRDGMSDTTPEHPTGVDRRLCGLRGARHRRVPGARIGGLRRGAGRRPQAARRRGAGAGAVRPRADRVGVPPARPGRLLLRGPPGARPGRRIPAVEYAVPFAARLAERYGLPGRAWAPPNAARQTLVAHRRGRRRDRQPGLEPVCSAAELAGFMRGIQARWC